MTSRVGFPKEAAMLSTLTAKYTRTDSGYMAQIVEWPEVVTEGKDLEEARAMLEDALREMVQAYRQQDKEIPAAETEPVSSLPYPSV